MSAVQHKRQDADDMEAAEGSSQGSARSGIRAGGASWLVGVYLLVTSTATPSLLGQPYAFAVLTWGGGLAVNALMAVSSIYCMYHQASVFHYKGRRLTTYRSMGDAVLGPRGGLAVEVMQFFINLGAVITNTILAGQMLQDVYTSLCTDPSTCRFTSLAAWTAISGAFSWFLVVAVRSMSKMKLVGLAAGVAFLVYSASAVGMAAADGVAARAPRDYSAAGGVEAKWLNALNGVGMLLFQYGVTVLPEIQAVLKDDPKTGNSTPTMIRAAVAAHLVFVPVFLLVGCVGYWAYGNSVNEFLLFATTRPAALVAFCNILGVLQLQVANQIYALPMFARLESMIVAKHPRSPWFRSGHLARRREGKARLAADPAAGKEDASSAAAAEAIVIEDVPEGQEEGEDGEGERPQPSWLLQLVHRTAWVAFWSTFAVALPFFAQIMGFFGAVGFGPITYALPTYLYMMAFKEGMPRHKWLFNAAFVVFWLVASAAAAVGAVYGIVVAASAHDFFI